MPPPLVSLSSNHFDKTENFMKRNISRRWLVNSELRCFRQGVSNSLLFSVTLLRACVLSSVQLCNPMDCGPPGSTVHGLFQARILEWAACPSPGALPDPGIQPTPPALAGRFLTTTGILPSATWEAHRLTSGQEHSILNKKLWINSSKEDE